MTDYESLRIQDELIQNDDFISNYNLVMYQRKMAKEYPFYPLEKKDWHKLHMNTITKKGLEQLEILRKEITMGRASREDIIIYTYLLPLYVCANPSNKRAKNYSMEINFHFNDVLGCNYYPNLIKEGLAIDNPNYSFEVMEKWSKWGLNLIQRCYRLAKQEAEK